MKEAAPDTKEARMKELEGRRINGLFVNEDQSVLVFRTDTGDVSYQTDGDCCSETWFADIIGVGNLLGHTVNKAEEVELVAPDPPDDRSRQEEDLYYGVKLTTEAGYVDIIYRNSSNGYYGGSIGLTVPDKPWTGLAEITKDWQAGVPVER